MITDIIESKNYQGQAERLNKAAAILDLIEYADGRIQQQQENINTWHSFDFKSKSYWENRKSVTEAARLRLIHRYKVIISQLAKISYTL